MNSAQSPASPDLERVQQWSLIVGGIALALCVGGTFSGPTSLTQFFRSYLVAYLFWVGLALGCVAMVMLHHLVGGAWGFVIRRLLESGTRTLPLMALFVLPLLVWGLPRLYGWAIPGATTENFPLFKRVYLDLPFFVGRTVVYFCAWIILAYFLNKWSCEQDRTADAALIGRLQAISGPGLVIYGLTVTFASVDWAMSLEPNWFSTIYGMMFVVAQALAALAFVIIVLMLLADRKPFSDVLSPAHFHDLGNLLLTFVILWAYLSFSQYLIIWAGNLQDEIPWYLSRSAGGWAWVALFLIVFHFTVPFLLLLSRDVKQRMRVLAAVAVALIFVSWVDLYWVVVPAFESAGPHIHWMDLLAPIGIGGIWLAAFIRQLKGRPLLPLHDPRFT